jgi:ABC-2 type transport system ATP-binding protein
MESVFQEEIASIKAQGKAVLLSSHILSEVERLADRVVIISKGTIVERGTLDQLRHLTRSTVTISAVGDLGTLEHLEGVHDFVRKGVSATFSLDNAATNDVLRHATKLGITKFEAVPPTLEDLFMRHYAA